MKNFIVKIYTSQTNQEYIVLWVCIKYDVYAVKQQLSKYKKYQEIKLISPKAIGKYGGYFSHHIKKNNFSEMNSYVEKLIKMWYQVSSNHEIYF